jgi:hypothetical protein
MERFDSLALPALLATLAFFSSFSSKRTRERREGIPLFFWRRWRDVEPVLRQTPACQKPLPAQNLGKGYRLFESCIPLIFTKIKRNATRAFLFILAMGYEKDIFVYEFELSHCSSTVNFIC